MQVKARARYTDLEISKEIQMGETYDVSPERAQVLAKAGLVEVLPVIPSFVSEPATALDSSSLPSLDNKDKK